MRGQTYTTTVNGVGYEYWADFNMRCTYAKNTETEEIKMIRGSGYIHKDLTVRKAIASAFKTGTFRK